MARVAGEEEILVAGLVALEVAETSALVVSPSEDAGVRGVWRGRGPEVRRLWQRLLLWTSAPGAPTYHVTNVDNIIMFWWINPPKL